jgi:archaellum component FlaC
MAHTEVLRITHSIREEVKIVDGKVERVDDKVDGVGVRVHEVGDKVEDIGDQVQCVNDKVQVVIDGARGLFGQLTQASNIYTLRRQTSKSSGEGYW